MPLYEYEILTGKGEGTGRTFEVMQSLHAPALTTHPETGEPVRRIISVPTIAGKWSGMAARSSLSNKNLERLGFTKYERRGDGYMERVAGKHGPRELTADD